MFLANIFLSSREYIALFLAAMLLAVAGFMTALAVDDGRGQKAAQPSLPAPVTPD